MKKTLLTFILFLLGWGILNAQEIPIESPPPSLPAEIVDEIISKPIFLGCEYITDVNSLEMEQCFRDNIRKKITNRLFENLDLLDSFGLSRMTTTITIFINEEREMAEVKTESGNSHGFNSLVLREMKKIAAETANLMPAKKEDGKPTLYLYRIPITFVFQD